MNPFDGLAYGFGIACTPENFLAALAGSFLGTAVGILPGMSPTVAMALLLVPTMAMKAETGLILLMAVYFGTQYGDSLTAILMGVPSEPPSMVIGIDGYQIAKKGRAGAALSVAAVGSFIGANIGLIGVTLVALPLAQAALAFGPSEYFAVTVVGLVALSRVSSGSLLKGLAAMGLGLIIPTVGMEPMTGTPRFTFGIPGLLMGMELVPVIMGLVGMAEMFEMTGIGTGLPQAETLDYRKLLPTRREWADAIPASFRGGFIGFLLGLLPGPTLILSTFASYRLEKRLAPTEVGNGSVRAVAGPKAADDGAVSANTTPVLCLGIPFGQNTAILFAGLLLHGITPGPTLVSEHPEVFWGLIAAMYVGNAALLVLNFPLMGVWLSFLRIPQAGLSALLVVLMMIGSYCLRNSVVDVFTMLAMGLLGYLMKQLDYPRPLLILGLVLGPMVEASFSRSLGLSGGDPRIFLESPISQALWAILLVLLLAPMAWRRASTAKPTDTATGEGIPGSAKDI